MKDGVLEPGDIVTYKDEVGVDHNALVLIVHGGTADSCINLIYVSDDPTKRDSYGRQVEHASSVQKKSDFTAPNGRFFTV